MSELNKPVAMVLGGTVPHKELIRQLKIRGYYTVLIDYYEDTPAKAEADIHIKESTLDKEKVLEIAREYDCTLIIDGCVDQANISACYAMEMMGSRGPYSYQTAVNITNKGFMKQVMRENNIPTSKFVYIDKAEDFVPEKLGLKFPVMVKPADSNSANGIRKADNLEQTGNYLEIALKTSRNGRAVIEEYITGREISAYCYVKKGTAKLLLTAERLSTFDGDGKIIKCYATIAPAGISAAARKKAEDVASQIAMAFNLKDTFLFFQGIVSGNEINVIEFAPRIGGGACFATIKESTGFDPISATIDNWLGRDVSLTSWHQPGKKIAVNTIYGKDGVFSHLEGVNEVLRNCAAHLFQIRSGGDRIDNSSASKSRIAFAVIAADTTEELLRKVHTLYETLRVIDSEGNNIIRRDLNLEVLWHELNNEQTGMTMSC